MRMSTDPIQRAIEAIGSQNALADALGIRAPSITGWKNRSKVPASRCLAIEQATGGAVTRYELRPDVYGAKPIHADKVA